MTLSVTRPCLETINVTTVTKIDHERAASIDEQEGIEMGNYMVNGEIIDVREDQPTAADLKRHTGSVLSDWVMASMPDGQIVKLDDYKTLPADAVDYSVVTPFTYGHAAGPECHR